MRYLTFALAKGRLAEEAMELLNRVGISCEEMKEKSRKLIFVNEELKYKFFLSKTDDVPTYVEYGAADIGVCGKDTLLEKRRNLYEVLDLNFGNCQMIVAGLAGNSTLLKNGNNFRVATKYPALAADYFRQRKQTVEIVKLNGSVELAPIVSLADFIVDITQTGETIKANGLEIMDEIMPLSARLVVNRASIKMEHTRITELVSKLKTAMGAEKLADN
ncbi:MAG: ATP phosphoribosyltransferase [Clostridiales bacterium]|jgi:ATP phosphoribosyltransferase|nr:ATP phosphoribosyltransferase [Clostridiales bacterium]